MKDKFVKKYMRMAKQFGQDSNPCYSRQIGVIVVNPLTNTVTGTGYNGPPPNTPHCDDEEYLRDFFWPQLTQEEKCQLTEKMLQEKYPGVRKTYSENSMGEVCNHFANCGVCPRRLINAGPGERSDLCSCQHAERNAITGSQANLYLNHMFCWCGVPCIQCTGAIIKAGIKDVHCLIASDYHPVSRWLFRKADVKVVEYDESYFNES